MRIGAEQSAAAAVAHRPFRWRPGPSRQRLRLLTDECREAAAGTQWHPLHRACGRACLPKLSALSRMVCMPGCEQGEFKSDRYDGTGVYTWKDGSSYKGAWKEGKYVHWGGGGVCGLCAASLPHVCAVGADVPCTQCPCRELAGPGRSHFDALCARGVCSACCVSAKCAMRARSCPVCSAWLVVPRVPCCARWAHHPQDARRRFLHRPRRRGVVRAVLQRQVLQWQSVLGAEVRCRGRGVTGPARRPWACATQRTARPVCVCEEWWVRMVPFSFLFFCVHSDNAQPACSSGLGTRGTLTQSWYACHPVPRTPSPCVAVH
jgi:hypothetical protein